MLTSQSYDAIVFGRTHDSVIFFFKFKNSLSSNHRVVFRILTRVSKISVPNIIAVGLYREILKVTQFEKFYNNAEMKDIGNGTSFARSLKRHIEYKGQY